MNHISLEDFINDEIKYHREAARWYYGQACGWEHRFKYDFRNARNHIARVVVYKQLLKELKTIREV